MRLRLRSLLAFPLLLAAAEPRFKVAIITAPAPTQTYSYTGFQFKDDQTVWGTLLTLKQVIKHAYQLTDEQIAGGPDWAGKEMFDITAISGQPVTMADLDAMLQTMLVERFNLRVHYETRMMPVYVLTVDKSGSKLALAPKPDGFAIPIKSAGFGKRPGTIALQSTSGSMPEFALVLGRILGRPVVDHTGLDQFYNFRLEYMNSGRHYEETETVWRPDGPYLFDGLRHQLGLRLDAKKVPVEVLVIDRAEKPVLDHPSIASPTE